MLDFHWFCFNWNQFNSNNEVDINKWYILLNDSDGKSVALLFIINL